MKRRLFFGPLAALAAVLFWAPEGAARRLEDWPYDRLFKEADVVVIAEAVAVADAGETTTENLWKQEFVGVVTTFKVGALLKGKGFLGEGEKLEVLHFRLPTDVRIENGPCLVSFRLEGVPIRTKTARMNLGKPEYLLFLKKGQGRRYEPVSGRTDPALSVREMFHPLPEELGKGKSD
jgi:hypothetical protein